MKSVTHHSTLSQHTARKIDWLKGENCSDVHEAGSVHMEVCEELNQVNM